MEMLLLSAKDLVLLLWNVFLSMVLLWLILHLFMSVIKTLFCDVQIKLYRVLRKRLKHYMNNNELEKVLNEVVGQKKN